MKKVFFRNFLFYSLSFVWIIILSTLISLNNKLELHLKTNQISTEELDYFFVYYTHFGDGLFSFILAIVVAFTNIKHGVIIFLSFLFSGLITQIMKHFLFVEYKRPAYYFLDNNSFHKIENYAYHMNFSFPSGHATSIFALTTALSLIYSNSKSIQVFLFLVAISVSFSRVYLSQHFYIDILIGAVIGVLCSTMIYQILHSKLNSLNRPLFSYFKGTNI